MIFLIYNFGKKSHIWLDKFRKNHNLTKYTIEKKCNIVKKKKIYFL